MPEPADFVPTSTSITPANPAWFSVVYAWSGALLRSLSPSFAFTVSK